MRGTFKFLFGNKSPEPDPLHAFFVRVFRPSGVEGKVDPAEVEVCKRVLELVRERWEDELSKDLSNMRLVSALLLFVGGMLAPNSKVWRVSRGSPPGGACSWRG